MQRKGLVIINYVEPIRDKDKLKDLLEYLKRTNPRNHLMFCLGIYTGLRISDILRLKVGTINIKNRTINIREKKTGKQRIIRINKNLKTVLESYIIGKPEDEYLIKSRNGVNKAISRDMASKIIKQTCEDFGIYNANTHSLRKTFGYHHYLNTKDIVVLQKIYNHSSPSVTMRYIGMVQDTMNEAIENFNIFD